MSLPINDFTFKEKVACCKEYLGFICITTNKEEDRRKLFVKQVVPLKKQTI